MSTLFAERQNVRYRQLDSLRGLAALCVFFSHYFLIFGLKDTALKFLIASPIGVLLNGHAAVMFFFVLSGFVLSLPFIDNQKPLPIIEFYIKRIFRIYPAFILAILLAIVLKTYVYDEHGIGVFPQWIKHFWFWRWNNQNYLEIAKTFILIGPNFNADLINPVIWSLVVEMKMCLILPFFIVIISRGNLLFNLTFFVIVLLLVFNHQPGYLGVFYLGTLCAKYKEQLIAKVKLLNNVLIISVLVFSVVLYNINYEFSTAYGDKVHPFQYFWRDYLTAIGSCIVIIIAISRKTIINLLQNRVLVLIGDISYSFYLIHLSLLITICSIVSLRSMFSYQYIFLLVIVLSVTISYLIYKYVEIPFQKYAKKIVNRSNMLKRFNLQA